MDQKKLDRISELTRLARQRALTEEETVERAMRELDTLLDRTLQAMRDCEEEIEAAVAAL